jgi:SPP1 gp7 family putative phage head morphogenesis protein
MAEEIILAPIKDNNKDFDSLELMIRKIFLEEIFFPLAKIIKAKLITNEKKSPLQEAIRSNKISFNHGKFTGTFSSEVSKELRKMGAKFKKDGFYIRSTQMPKHIRDDVVASENRFNVVLERINSQLNNISPIEIADKLKSQSFFSKTLWKTEEKISKSLQSASKIKAISIQPKLTDEQRKLIAEDYTNNLKKYIKNFSEEEVLKLRQFVQKKVMDGERYGGLIDIIQKRYEVSANKAKFLARQETKLMMAKFKEGRYKDAGINSYIWQTVVGSPLHPVRPMHKALNGKKFQFDNPPVTDAKGNRNNPGEDYNCRCTASPVVKF